jgi:hypothetical protein
MENNLTQHNHQRSSTFNTQQVFNGGMMFTKGQDICFYLSALNVLFQKKRQHGVASLTCALHDWDIKNISCF